MFIFRDDFRDYAELCFKEFGDRVKHWITLNEPLSYTNASYVMGTSPPGRCSSWQQLNCTGGDSGTEPYLVSQNQLLAYASAVKIYKQKCQVFTHQIALCLFYYFFLLFENCTPFNKPWLHCT